LISGSLSQQGAQTIVRMTSRSLPLPKYSLAIFDPLCADSFLQTGHSYVPSFM
jgi:hypothetical protein